MRVISVAWLRLAALLGALALAGCSVPGPGGAPGGIHDPFEAKNREAHDFNKRVDQRFFSGDGPGYAETVPEPVQAAISGFADTTSLPQTIVNQVLQGRLWRATKNTLRFGLNATLGLTVLDPASEIGLGPDDSDFGETLHVWGLPEGAYMELPFLGPTTERDAVGRFVDLFTDPLSYVVPAPERYSATVAGILDDVGDRSRYSDTVGSVLYDSADSYAQTRLIYLQKRRFELGMEPPGAEEIDPFAIDTTGF